MIEPNVATMLCFLYTDADFPANVLRDCLKDAVKDSFNMLTVDGDTSTNDTVLLTATGKAKGNVEDFREALRYVCVDLARQMARDGEGASKYFETVVTGARNEEDARLAAKAVARSSLVKTAVYGADPNWGRIICAVGYSGAEMDPEKITLGLEGESPAGGSACPQRSRWWRRATSWKAYWIRPGRSCEGTLSSSTSTSAWAKPVRAALAAT